MSPSHRMDRPGWLRAAVEAIRRNPDPSFVASAKAERLAAGSIGFVVLLVAIGTYFAAVRWFSPATDQPAANRARTAPTTAAATASPTAPAPTAVPSPSPTANPIGPPSPTTVVQRMPSAAPRGTASATTSPTAPPATSAPGTSPPPTPTSSPTPSPVGVS